VGRALSVGDTPTSSVKEGRSIWTHQVRCSKTEVGSAEFVRIIIATVCVCLRLHDPRLEDSISRGIPNYKL